MELNTVTDTTKILAFRLVKSDYEALLRRAKPEESKSDLLRRMVNDFLTKTEVSGR